MYRTIDDLRDLADAIRREELARVEPRLRDMPPLARRRVEMLTQSLVEALLEEPLARLSADGADARLEASVRHLFGLAAARDRALAS